MDKTIAAISTPSGKGGIGIIRMSGIKAINIADKIFKGFKGKSLLNVKSHTVHYGYILDGGKKLDEVLVTVMRAPNTYTKEDIVEINCHASTFGVKKILELVLKNGADLAAPGEFTKRAFLNGRIDLASAEAVIDVINSKTSTQHNISVNQLGGSLSQKINEIRNNLLDLTANLNAVMDFPEEGLEPLGDNEYYDGLVAIKEKIEKLLATSVKGRIIKEGINTVIAGKPNVGKSSFLNYLSGSDRAIVTDVEGTTRDAIEENIDLGNVRLNVFDTAGIRNTDDTVEKIGVEKSKMLLEKAELVIYMLDSKKEIDDNDLEIYNLVNDKKLIILANKSEDGIEKSVKDFCADKENVIYCSVKKEQGLDEVKNTILNMFDMGDLEEDMSETITNIRHKDSLTKALASVKSAIDALNLSMPLDMTFVDIENAISSLGEITGMSVGEEIVDRIFHSFCVGK
ncbi:MAG: tRNA uridine-5-carboxymethylaminomethyl(34) synthesis GTPase MnmE [Ruminococcaceae bacterium]|nr:tRNA uridine-5-carboxymethylaminomethyl(34) synthesis GTPase MnmE [Oscillospiraceae bacterium]